MIKIEEGTQNISYDTIKKFMRNGIYRIISGEDPSKVKIDLQIGGLVRITYYGINSWKSGKSSTQGDELLEKLTKLTNLIKPFGVAQ
ncbi:MAG: hypothetical protein OQK82_04445 [Candidatus Pacearchaeota archaeon]|nr:hypothetical protein [Candidatus Pacearchaeota archaeon]